MYSYLRFYLFLMKQRRQKLFMVYCVSMIYILQNFNCLRMR